MSDVEVNEVKIWKEELASVELPAWFSELLPKLREEAVIKWDSEGERFVLLSPRGAVLATGTSYGEVYDTFRENYEEEFTLITDESVNGHGGSLVGGSFSEDFDEGKRYARFFPTVDDDTHLALHKSSYKSWLECHESWLKNQEDWVEAYNWLTLHPAFWYKHEQDEAPTWHWETNNGLSSLWVAVQRDKSGPVVMMEHGAHVAPQYTQHYHDIRLDVYAPSFEEGYVKLAKLVHKFFHDDGTEREHVDYKNLSWNSCLKSTSRQ